MWVEQVPGKWANTETGYALRCDNDGRWMAYTAQSVPLSMGYDTIEDAQAAADAHFVEVMNNG